MKRFSKFFQLIVLATCALPLCSKGETDQDAIALATAAVKAATPRAQADPTHPIFHVASPAQWMNDPNGPIFYKGYYHLFYQLTPFSDESGVKYWGHVRSRDLVKWERLPIAIAPSANLGEESIWSGCCTINGEGKPMIFYTSIGKGKSPFDQAEQWAAVGDDKLIHWQKSPANPVLSDAVNDGTKIYDWRDPFIFKDGKETFMVLGGHLAEKGQAAVNIYEAENLALTKWKYRGVLFHIPDAPTAECPNFFKLGDQWVLFVSPYGKVQYFIGDFDAKTCRFHPKTHGLVDYGPNFYAPNTMQLGDGRRLVWGWVNGFPSGHGWNGCLSLPRLLSLSADGQLQQKPAPQLQKLRGRLMSLTNVALTAQGTALKLPETNAMEIEVEFELSTNKQLALEFRDADSVAPALAIHFTGTELKVQGASAPLNADDKLSLHIFLDRSVMEVFANDSICITKTIQPLGKDAKLVIHAGAKADLQQLRAWPMKSIW